MITIENINGELAESLCRKITADLPEYFGLPEANEHYAQGVKAYANFAGKKNGNYIGLISINFPYHVMTELKKNPTQRSAFCVSPENV